MRITIGIFSLRPYSGLSNDCVALADKLHAKGHEVLLVCGDIRYRIDREYAIKDLGISAIDNASFNRRSADEIRSTHKNRNNDLLIGFNKMPDLDIYYMGDFCWADKVKQHSKWHLERSPRHRLQLEFERCVYAKNGPFILSQSLREKRRFQHYYHTQENRFFDVQPRANERNIVSVNADRCEQIRQQFNTHENDIVWLAVGNGFKTKGVDRSIKALANARLAHCQLWIVGNDPPKRYAEMAKRINVENRLHFLGVRDDVGILMHAADILLHPARSELSGTVIIEAIANHLPVVCTKNCGNARYVSDSNAGFTISEQFNQLEYESTIATLSLNYDLRRRCKLNAREYYEHNKGNWERFFEEIVEQIESLQPVY